MKLLVTGGAGFIGGNFVHYMIDKYSNYRIWNMDLLTYAGDLTKHQEIEGCSNYSFVNIDISDRAAVEKVFRKEKFDCVVHFAAESHVDRSIADSEVFIRTNVLGTHTLLEVAKNYGIKKFVHISTDEVYGELNFDPAIFFTEDTSLKPNSPYSASKASSDLLVRAYYETYSLPINITRCSNNYGPYHFPEKLIPLTISRALDNQKIPVYGEGKNVRDWLHVFDHCSAIDLILHKGVNGEVYNIGGHNEKTNLEVVQAILKSLNKSEELIEYIEDRPGHDKRYAIDPTKLVTLGWQPKYNFENGLNQTIQWYLDNKKWLEKIMTGEYQNYFKSQYALK